MFFVMISIMRVVIVNDKMQTGYSYQCVAHVGRDFAADFKPELTPMDMLRLGVFEGHYLNDCRAEFPDEWFENARLSIEVADVRCNCFGVKSRLSLAEWQRRQWIFGPDVRGWFQWYCRYYMGRRLPDIDAIQIRRWKAFRRHQAQIMKNCMSYDVMCRPRQRQALLQWAYNPFI